MRRSLYIVLICLLLGGVFWGVSSAFAGMSAVFGFVPAQGVVRDAADARLLAELLAERLAVTVKVRLFDSEAELHQWLSRYREVDCGWLSTAYLHTLPAGEVLLLAGADDTTGAVLPGQLVVRQGVDAVFLQQMREALLAFGSRPEEAALLATLQITRFVVADHLAEVERPVPAPLPAPAPLAAPPVVPAPPVTTPPTALPPAPSAAPPSTAELPISLAAERLEYQGENELVQASGAVLLQRGDTTLAADRLLWQEKTGDVAASGDVRLAEPAAEFHGSSLSANLATGLGLARDGRVFLAERNFHLAGDEIERLGETSYRVRGGRFTTCDGEIPDWQFTADQVDVTLGRYATARNVWFEIRNRPFLYLPYLLFPVKSERESGFLLPRVGYSGRKGSLLSLAWYEVIDRHLDATIYLDALSRIGIGKGLEYRYALQGDNAGEALYYHVTGVKDNDDTFALKWRHTGTLPGRVRLAADVDYVEDIEYFEDFGETAEDFTRDHTVSTIMLQRNWQNLNLTVLNEYIRDLAGNNDATVQRLPEVDLSSPRYRLGDSPFYLRAENALTNFVRQEGVDGQRLYVHPELSVSLKPGSWLELMPRVAVHGRYYHVDSTDDGRDRSDYDNDSLVAEYALTASTRFTRVFPFGRWGVEKLRHSIEPEVTYAYLPEGSQERLPLFDVFDRIGPANRLEYALINRLTGRTVDAEGHRTYRELLNLRLSQFYDIAVARDDRLSDPEEFSPLRVELLVSPAAGSFLDLEAWLPVYGDQRFSRITASAGYSGQHGNAASLDYAYARAEDGAVPSDYLGLNLTTALLAPVYLNFRERYDFRGGQSLESLLNLEYREKCWSLFLTLRNRPAVDGGADNNEVMVGFALSGLGRVGGFGGSLGPTAQ